jgi:hypothetical protein
MFQEELSQQQVKSYKDKNRFENADRIIDNNGIYPIQFLEKAFAEEITFMYYLNLLAPIYYPVVFPNDGFVSMLYESISTRINKPSNNRDYDDQWTSTSLPLLPKDRLLMILSSDMDIRKWFSSYIHDLILYHNKAATYMRQFYNEISN